MADSYAKLVVRFGGDASEFKKAVDEMIGQSKELNEKMHSFGETLKTAFEVFAIYEAGKAVMEFGKGLAEFAVHGIEAAASLQKLHEQTGLSVTLLDDLKHATVEADESFDDVTGGLQKLAKMFGEIELGGKKGEEAAGKLKLLGINAEDLAGMTMDQKFKAVANAVAGMSDEMRDAALAEAGLGKSFAPMAHVLQNGMENINNAAKELKENGLGISTEQFKMAELAASAMKQFGQTIEDIQRIIGGELAKYIYGANEEFKDWAKSGKNLGDTIRDAMKTVIVSVIHAAAEVEKLFVRIENFHPMKDAQWAIGAPMIEKKTGKFVTAGEYAQATAMNAANSLNYRQATPEEARTAGNPANLTNAQADARAAYQNIYGNDKMKTPEEIERDAKAAEARALTFFDEMSAKGEAKAKEELAKDAAKEEANNFKASMKKGGFGFAMGGFGGFADKMFGNPQPLSKEQLKIEEERKKLIAEVNQEIKDGKKIDETRLWLRMQDLHYGDKELQQERNFVHANNQKLDAQKQETKDHAQMIKAKDKQEAAELREFNRRQKAANKHHSAHNNKHGAAFGTAGEAAVGYVAINQRMAQAGHDQVYYLERIYNEGVRGADAPLGIPA